MTLLNHDERDRLISLLKQLPNIEDAAVRDMLLAGLPRELRLSVKSSGIPLVDLHAILEATESPTWAHLSDGSWPLLRVIENACGMVRGTQLEEKLQQLADTVRERIRRLNKQEKKERPNPKPPSRQLLALLVLPVLLMVTGIGLLLARPPERAPVRLLVHFWHPQREDNHLTTTDMGLQQAERDGYQRVHSVEGFIYAGRLPETSPLFRYFNEKNADYALAATPESQRLLEEQGYQRQELEGYIYTTQQPGAVPLNMYFSDQRKDYFLTATEQGQQLAVLRGYQFLRVEGYVSFPNETITFQENQWLVSDKCELPVLADFGGSMVSNLYLRSDDRFYEIGRHGQLSYGYVYSKEYQGIGWVETRWLREPSIMTWFERRLRGFTDCS